APILVAQQDVRDDRTSNRIQALAFQNGKYVNIATITPPTSLSIYEMALGTSVKNQDRMYVAYVHNHKIAAFTHSGETLWNTGQEFDGSLNYFEYSDREAIDTARYYLTQRILLADTDNNGMNEVIAVKNINSNPSFMEKSKRYKRGYISCLEWDDTNALRLKWKTIEEQGYISDMAVADATNDGKADLIFTVVTQTGAMLKKTSNSYLVIQQLP
ncbi:unnamed protein product, partial [marine sediment metagenome]